MAIDQPHDALFREVFQDPEQAAPLLRSVLPAALATRLDLGSLRLEPGSFVDAELRCAWRGAGRCCTCSWTRAPSIP